MPHLHDKCRFAVRRQQPGAGKSMSRMSTGLRSNASIAFTRYARFKSVFILSSVLLFKISSRPEKYWSEEMDVSCTLFIAIVVEALRSIKIIR